MPELGSGVELSLWEVCRQILEGQQQMGVERGGGRRALTGQLPYLGAPSRRAEIS